MKILIPLTVDFGPAGGFRVLSQLANHWIDAGHDVTFLAYQDFDKPYYPTKADIIFFDGFGRIVSEKKRDFAPVKSLQLRWAARRALDQLDADVVLATQSFSAGPVAKSKIKADKFYYIQADERDFYVDGGIKDRIYHKIADKSYSYPLNQIVNSEMYRDYRGIKTDRVVFPGLAQDIYYPKKDRLTKKDKFIFGTVGRTQKIKGTFYVIEAFRKLRELYGEKVELHVAFGSEDLADIEGIKVVQPHGDKLLADFYRSLDVYICAGLFQLQAVHYPVIESMACKTALITTGYFPSSEANAEIIDVESSDAIVKAAEKIMADPESAEKKAVKALEEVTQFYWPTVASKMLQYFKD